MIPHRASAPFATAAAVLSAGPAFAFLFSLALLLPGRTDAAGISFVDRAAEAGVTVVNRCGEPPRMFIPDGNGCGAAWLDYDRDGDLDLYVVNGARFEPLDGGTRLRIVADEGNRLYRNDGAWRFTDVTDAAGVGDRGWGNGCAVADVNEDGLPDLYVANLGPDVLYVNRGDGTFADETTARGLGHAGWSTGAAFGDPDRDGDLDLFVPCYVAFDPDHPPADGKPMVYEGVELPWGPEGENPGVNPGDANVYWVNDGAGRFTEATAAHGLAREKPLCSYTAVFADVDGDGWDDLLVTNDVQPNSYFRNRGDGTFAENAEAIGFARSEEGEYQAGMGLAAADLDDDGDPDFVVTNFDFEPNNLLLNDGKAGLREIAATAGVADASMNRLGWGCGFLDVELDGDLDLFVANGHVMMQCEDIGMNPWKMANQLFLREGTNAGAPLFRLYEPDAGSPLALVESSRGVAFGDADNDGDVDLVIVDMDRPVQLLENTSERAGHWLAVALTGTRSPRDAYGARVTVEAGGVTHTAWKIPNQGIYSSQDPRVHFGLGNVARIDRVTVRWTSGAVSERTDVPLDALVVMTEPDDDGATAGAAASRGHAEVGSR